MMPFLLGSQNAPSYNALPAPSTSSFGRSRTRNRLLIAAIASAFAFLLTHHLSRTYGYLSGMPDRPDLYEEPRERPVFRPDVTIHNDEDVLRIPPAAPPPPKPPIPPAPAPKRPSVFRPGRPDDEAEATLPPIRWPKEPLHPHSFPPTSSNPWPNSPHIIEDYLRDDLESIPPPLPSWPADRDVRSKPLDKKLQVPFKALYTARGFVWKSPPTARGTMPKIQYDFAEAEVQESEERREEREQRKEWVKKAAMHAWNGYKRYAWGHDELRPLANQPWDGFNGWGATMVDALDTLLLMGLTKEYDYARTHVKALDFTLLTGGASAYGSADGVTIPTFETCIRYLGGLLGAYDVSGGDEVMLERAKDLGDWMMGAFGTHSGLPQGRYRLGQNPKGDKGGRMVLSEAGSMTLEYTRLSLATGDPSYYSVVQRTMDFFDTQFNNAPNRPGKLLPQYIAPAIPGSLSGIYGFSAMCDSYYEYLHLLLGGGTTQYGRMYAEAMDSAYDHIIKDAAIPGEDLVLVGELSYGQYKPSLEHLTCFAGAMMGLGGKLLDRTRDLATASKFAYSCFWAYNSSSSGIGPESMLFYKEKDIDRFDTQRDKETGSYFRVPRGDPPGVRYGGNSGYGGRPETIESVFYLYRITGDPVWQDRAWQMFVAWVEHTITDSGFAGLHSVSAPKLIKRDTQESFVFAETLKYYYLIFCEPDFLSLDDWVFNTEAHPFRLRPEEPLAVPLHSWTTPDPQIQLDYLEPNHAKSNGRGTVLQRQFRADNPGGSVRGMLNNVRKGKGGAGRGMGG